MRKSQNNPHPCQNNPHNCIDLYLDNMIHYKRGNKMTKEGTKQVNTRLPKSMYEQLKKRAILESNRTQEIVSVMDIVRALVQRYLSEGDNTKGGE